MSYSTVSALFTAICDAIRGKDGTQAQINHQDIPARITALPSGGDATWDEISKETFSETDVVVTGAGKSRTTAEQCPKPYAFYGTNITSFTSRTTYTCNLGYNAFQNCSSLKTVEITSEAKFPSGGSSTGSSPFYNCTALEKVKLDCTTISNDLFKCATGVIYQNLTEVVFDRVESFGNAVFTNMNAPNLETLDIGKRSANAYGIGCPLPGCFNYNSLTNLILRTTSAIWTISDATYIPQSIINGTGYIYVPQALLTSYQSATNWSTVSSQFRALENYTVDGTTTGALDPSKI